jgi:hypothetical protein
MELGKCDAAWLTGPQVQRHFNVSSMAIWRWLHDPHLNFPTPTKIRRRNYWRAASIQEFERRMVVEGVRVRANHD